MRPIRPQDDATATLRLLVGRWRDLTQDHIRRISRLRQLLSRVHPGLEAELDPTRKGPFAWFTRYVTPAEIARATPSTHGRSVSEGTAGEAGGGAIVRHLRRAPNLRDPERPADPARARAARQRGAVPGEATLAHFVRGMAAEAPSVRGRLASPDKELETPVKAHPRSALVPLLPGMEVVLGAEFIAVAGDVSRFRSPAALAAGLASVLRQSGRSHTLRRARHGDRDLKRVRPLNSLSALVACAVYPESRAYYDRRRHEGKHHAQAVVALARRRTDVLRAMLRHDRAYDPNHRDTGLAHRAA